MKQKLLRTMTVTTLLVLMTLLAAMSISNERQVKAQQEQTHKSFREIARERDVEWNVREGHFNVEYSDLRQLAKDSDAIVIGHIIKEESYFGTDNEITTRYEIEVHRVIKDGTQQASVLSHSLGRKTPEPLVTPLRFTRFGGTVHVNRHRAHMKLKGSELLTSGKTYVLFLEWTGWNYHIMGSMSGAVLIEDDLRVKPLGTNDKLKLKRHDELGLEAFIQEVLADETY